MDRVPSTETEFEIEKQPESETIGNSDKEIKHVPLYDTDCAVNLLAGISLASFESVDGTPGENEVVKLETESKDPLEQGFVPPVISDTLTCLSCDITLSDRQQQKEHYRSDFHRFNLKQKIKGLPSVTEAIFEEITGDISSISGSDSASSDESDNDTSINRKRSKKLWTSDNTQESDDEGSYHIEGEGRRHPRVFLRNGDGDLLSIYRCVIHGKKNQPETVDSLIKMTSDLSAQMNWAILMTGGGHFAGAIFNKEKVVVHKTFHRYVVRAKRGTAQGIHDQKGHAPKSGGATIRRYNEAALAKEIQDLIESWKEELGKCHRIFMRAPSSNKIIFFGGKSPALDKNDTRIRMIPFATRRATFKELRRVHSVLSSAHCYGKSSSFSDHVSPVPKKVVQMRKTQAASAHLTEVVEDCVDTEEEETCEDLSLVVADLTLDMTAALKPFEVTEKPRPKKTKKSSGREKQPVTTYPEIEKCRNDLYTACKTGDTTLYQTSLTRLHAFIANSKTPTESKTVGDKEAVTMATDNDAAVVTSSCVSPSNNLLIDQEVKTAIANFLSERFGDVDVTLLHVAAQEQQDMMIWKLLEDGADPVVKNQKGQYPYVITDNKETRKQFRKFREAFPDKYDYSKAQIPEPLSASREDEKKAKEAEKKKAQRKARKERLKEKKQEEVKVKAEENERQRFLALSDREKRALAAEKRLATQLKAAGQDIPVLSRCWQCAVDITGKVPFEYYDYKFCSTKCLRTHKQNPGTS